MSRADKGWLGCGPGVPGRAAGDQVAITDASGKVLATATLTGSGATPTFAATVPAEPRYGIKIGAVAPYYVTQAQAKQGIALTCGS
jgi:hypothetical protein